MPQARLDALGGQKVQDPLIGGKLGPGGLLVVIGAVEVGVDALDRQGRCVVDLGDGLGIRGVEAVAAHAGVDFYVAGEGMLLSLIHI